MQKEIGHLERIFEYINCYPTWAPTQIDESMQNNASRNPKSMTSNESKTTHCHITTLHDKGKRGKQALCHINKDISKEHFHKITNLKLLTMERKGQVSLTSKIWQKGSINMPLYIA